MTKGWHEVAKLGAGGARYPHILVDCHGWCLRLGPRSRSDEKYYASLPTLFHGLVEHSARRRLLSLSTSLDLKELRREVEDTLHSALSICHEVLVRGGLEEHVRRLQARSALGTSGGSPTVVPVDEIGGQDAKGLVERRQAM